MYDDVWKGTWKYVLIFIRHFLGCDAAREFLLFGGECLVYPSAHLSKEEKYGGAVVDVDTLPYDYQQHETVSWPLEIVAAFFIVIPSEEARKICNDSGGHVTVSRGLVTNHHDWE